MPVRTFYLQAYKEYEIIGEEATPREYDVYLLMRHTYDQLLTRYDLDTYRFEQHAIQAAKKFPELYEIAKQHGYHLTQQYLRNKDEKEVHISFAMDLDVTNERFISML